MNTAEFCNACNTADARPMTRIEIVKALATLGADFTHTAAATVVGSARFVRNSTHLASVGLIRAKTINVNGIDHTFFNLTGKARALVS